MQLSLNGFELLPELNLNGNRIVVAKVCIIKLCFKNIERLLFLFIGIEFLLNFRWTLRDFLKTICYDLRVLFHGKTFNRASHTQRKIISFFLKRFYSVTSLSKCKVLILSCESQPARWFSFSKLFITMKWIIVTEVFVLSRGFVCLLRKQRTLPWLSSGSWIWKKQTYLLTIDVAPLRILPLSNQALLWYNITPGHTPPPKTTSQTMNPVFPW